MEITINGESYNFDNNTTLENIVNHLNISLDNIVVEVNGEIVIKDKFSITNIKDNDIIEIIKFVGGG